MQPQNAQSVIYEAAHHCRECAVRRFGDDVGFHLSIKDSEGNTPTFSYTGDQWWEPADQPDVPYVQELECGTCHRIIAIWCQRFVLWIKE